MKELSDFVPQLRKDLVFKEFKSSSNLEDADYFILSDPAGIADDPLMLPIGFIPLLQMLNGSFTFRDIKNSLELQSGKDVDFIMKAFQNIIATLDEFCFLETDNYFQKQADFDEFMCSPIRKPICSGFTYSSNPTALKLEIQNILENWHSDSQISADAILCPHIDYRVNQDARDNYAAAYNSLTGNNSELFVILGTSHFGNSDYFMFSKKHYSTPLGIVNTDFDFLNQLENELSFKLTFDEMAHFKEHSIELQLPFLQYINSGKDITIIPILVGDLHRFINIQSSPYNNDSKIKEFLTTLKILLDKYGKKYSVICSVDFSHVGYKFGDNFDAKDKAEEISANDQKLISSILNNDADSFFNEITESHDMYKVCGISPIYSLLKMFSFSKINLLNYKYWYETETKSTVSFASFNFKF